MILNLIGQINIIKAMNFKPNYSELAREYGIDKRTVKKYCEGYEGKPKTRNKPSKLDKYYDEIKIKLSIKGITVKAVYEYFVDKNYDIGSYSNFMKYIKSKEIKLSKKTKYHPKFETPPGKQTQIDEIGYLPIDTDAANLFFQLISKRYEKHCTIITINSNFSKWSDIFGSAAIANAILDRLLHHSHIISVKGLSYRLKSKLHYLDRSSSRTS